VIVIDCEKYGERTEFVNLPEAERAVQECGYSGCRFALQIGSHDIVDQDGREVGYYSTLTLWWTRADGSASLNMGEYETRSEAEAAIQAAAAELLTQGLDSATLAKGAWEIELTE